MFFARYSNRKTDSERSFSSLSLSQAQPQTTHSLLVNSLTMQDDSNPNRTLSAFQGDFGSVHEYLLYHRLQLPAESPIMVVVRHLLDNKCNYNHVSSNILFDTVYNVETVSLIINLCWYKEHCVCKFSKLCKLKYKTCIH